MRQYERISGALFTLIALGQLARSIMGWPVRIADFDVPVWCSVVLFLLTGTLATWAFRVAAKPASA